MPFDQIKDFSSSDEILKALEASEIKNVYFAGSQILSLMEGQIAEEYRDDLTEAEKENIDGDAHNLDWGEGKWWKFWKHGLERNNLFEKKNADYFKEAMKINKRQGFLSGMINLAAYNFNLLRWNMGWGNKLKVDKNKKAEKTREELAKLRKDIAIELAGTYRAMDKKFDPGAYPGGPTGPEEVTSRESVKHEIDFETGGKKEISFSTKQTAKADVIQKFDLESISTTGTYEKNQSRVSATEWEVTFKNTNEIITIKLGLSTNKKSVVVTNVDKHVFADHAETITSRTLNQSVTLANGSSSTIDVKIDEVTKSGKITRFNISKIKGPAGYKIEQNKIDANTSNITFTNADEVITIPVKKSADGTSVELGSATATKIEKEKTSTITNVYKIKMTGSEAEVPVTIEQITKGDEIQRFKINTVTKPAGYDYEVKGASIVFTSATEVVTVPLILSSDKKSVILGKVETKTKVPEAKEKTDTIPYTYKIKFNGTEVEIPVKIKQITKDDKIQRFTIKEITWAPEGYKDTEISGDNLIFKSDTERVTASLTISSNKSKVRLNKVKRVEVTPLLSAGETLEEEVQMVNVNFKEGGSKAFDIDIKKIVKGGNITKFTISTSHNMAGYTRRIETVGTTEAKLIFESKKEIITIPFELKGNKVVRGTIESEDLESVANPLSLGAEIILGSSFMANHDKGIISNKKITMSNNFQNAKLRIDSHSSPSPNKVSEQTIRYPGGSASVSIFGPDVKFHTLFYDQSMDNTGGRGATYDGYIDWKKEVQEDQQVQIGEASPDTYFRHPGPFLQAEGNTKTGKYEIQGECVVNGKYQSAQEKSGTRDVTSQGLIVIRPNGKMVLGKKSDVLRQLGASNVSQLPAKGVQTAFQQIFLASLDKSGNITFGQHAGGSESEASFMNSYMTNEVGQFHCLVELHDGRQMNMNFDNIKRRDFYGIMKSIGAKNIVYLDNFGDIREGVGKYAGDNVDSFRTGGYIYSY